jgi:hypothetical protein
MMAWCTEMQTGEGRVVVKEIAAGDKSGEASNTIFRGHTPCYTNYSCTGLLGASQWSWPAWCSVVCYVCGAPLGVVSGTGSSPTTSLPPWEGLRLNQAINDITPSKLAFRGPMLRRIHSGCHLCKTSIVSPSRITFSVSVRRDGSGTAVSEKLESEVAECGEVEGHCAITSYRRQLSIVLDQHSSAPLVSTVVPLQRYTLPPRVPYCQRTLYTQAPDYDLLHSHMFAAS